LLIEGMMEKVSNKELEMLRDRIDELNLEILEKINERANLVQKIAQTKVTHGAHRYDPVRERKMLDDILAKNDGPFDNATIAHLFKQIFKAGLQLQQ